MKQERLKVRFECDQCLKKTRFEDQTETKFPYQRGWCYLYKFNIQLPNPKWNTTTNVNKRFARKDYQDKHFCCKKCMIEYLSEKVVMV